VTTCEDERRSGLFRDYPRNFFSLVIVDECHRGSATDESNWRAILEHFSSAVQIGMTATPLHTDNVQTYAYFGEPVARYSLRNGINDGFLAPYRVRRVLLGLATEGEHSVAAVRVELPAGTTVAAEQGAAADTASIVSEARSAETAATLREHTAVIARHLAEYLQRTNPMAKTMVFCVDQDHAEQMRLALQEACAEHVARYADYVVRIVSETGDEGKRALGRFSLPDERTPVIATTSRLLTTGVDVPTCQNVVLARPINSIVEFKQIIGRGARLHEPEKRWFTIIDYAGATNLFFDPDFDGDPELVEVEPLVPQPAEPTSAAEDGDSTPAAAEESVAASESPAATEGATEPSPVVVLAGQETHPAVTEPGAASQPPSNPASTDGAGGGEAADQPTGTTAPWAAPVAAPALATEPAEGGDGTGSSAETQVGQPAATPPAGEPPPGAPSHTITRGRDGRLLKIVGEVLYELGPDGRTLRPLSYRQYTVDALHELVTSPGELQARWLRPEQRDEIRERLREEGVDLPVLAAALNLPDADPLDLLLHVAFGERPLTRRERADRVRRQRGDFFARHGPAAREILEAILQKYVAGEAQHVDDMDLLKVPPLVERGTFLELVRPFGGGNATRAALAELQKLLYTA
jgi:type I restriction enzyme R subunit